MDAKIPVPCMMDSCCWKVEDSVKIKLHQTRAVFASNLEGQIREGLSASLELYSSRS